MAGMTGVGKKCLKEMLTRRLLLILLRVMLNLVREFRLNEASKSLLSHGTGKLFRGHFRY